MSDDNNESPFLSAMKNQVDEYIDFRKQMNKVSGIGESDEINTGFVYSMFDDYKARMDSMKAIIDDLTSQLAARDAAVEGLLDAVKYIALGHDGRCSYEDLGCYQCKALEALKAYRAAIGVTGEPK